MGGAAKTIGRAASGVFTLGGSEIARNNLGRNNIVSKGLQTPGMILTGGQSKGYGGGDDGYTPQTLPQSDPAMILAQSGGAPLLTNVALGGSVDDALAGYFGRTKGADFDTWLSNQSPDERAAINGVRNQLTQIQSNTDLRNKAVQSLVNDFPNVVSMTAPSVIKAKADAGQEFDAASQNAMDYALHASNSSANANGMLSSGAAAEAEARVGAQYGMQKLSYQNQQGNQQLDLLGTGWQEQYNEANALRGFQQKMLGQGVEQGFSANQNALQRNQYAGEFNAKIMNKKMAADAQQTQDMYSSVGGLAGTAIGGYFGGPIGAAAGSKVGSAGMAGYGNGGATPKLTDYNGGNA